MFSFPRPTMLKRNKGKHKIVKTKIFAVKLIKIKLIKQKTKISQIILIKREK